MAEIESTADYVRLTGLSKLYPGQLRPAVEALDLSVAKGELLALLGPSGCGKTSTLRMLAGLITPSAGRIHIAGRDVTQLPIHQRGLGMVFQSYALFPHLSVVRNVSFGLEMRHLPKAQSLVRAREALRLVELESLADRRVSELSGGQQQRVAIARALVIEPTVLLLDEPLSNLDAKLREAMRVEIKRIQQRTGVTTIFVTHDQDEALSMADRVAVMAGGRIEQIGAPETLYNRPSSRFVAEFIGRSNFIDAEVIGHETDHTILLHPLMGRLRAQYPATLKLGRVVSLMLRPHQLHLHSADISPGSWPSGTHWCTGVIEAASFTGNLSSCRVRLGEGDQALRLQAEFFSDAQAIPGVGQRVRLSWHERDLLIVDGAERA